MIKYLIEASLCLFVFYGVYWLLLRNEKLLNINRFYLLITSLISIIIPLIDIKVSTVFIDASITQATEQANLSEGIQRSQFISIESLYVFGLILTVIILGSRLLYMRKKLKPTGLMKSQGLNVVETEGSEAFSFLNTIFIGKELVDNERMRSHVMAHELAHIKGLHALDILYFEVLRCVFWFHPISYLYFRSIKLQHEYIADEAATRQTNARDYKNLLVEFTLSQVNTALVSSMKQHPIQKRLTMIHKLNSNIMNKLKPLFALPLLGVLFAFFSCSEEIEAVPDTLNAQSLEEEVKSVLSEERVIDDNVHIEIMDESEVPVEVIVEELKGALDNVSEIRADQIVFEEIPLDESAQLEVIHENGVKVTSVKTEFHPVSKEVIQLKDKNGELKNVTVIEIPKSDNNN